MQLGIGNFSYEDLSKPERLKALSDQFRSHLELSSPDLAQEFALYHVNQGKGMPRVQESDLLVRVAHYLGEFLARLFGVESERAVLLGLAADEAVILEFKKVSIQRRVRKMDAEKALEAVARFAELERIVEELKLRHLTPDQRKADDELVTACLWRAISNTPDAASDLHLLESWLAAVAVVNPARFRHWVSWRQPQPLDYSNLVQIERPDRDLKSLMAGPSHKLRRRDGFKLTDARFNGREVLDEIHYCIYCHERQKDSCSTGFVEKDGTYRKNPLGIPLEGCPLDERISEAHLVRRSGEAIGALALIMIDNPMCPGTGHRICNDCMKSCIFQKQEPVNIPQIETGILTDVLKMPWGIEIFDLLTRWNPLNVYRPFELEYNGKNILIVGMGPAGYTLAHHLLNEGFGVVGIDGLKIEPLPEKLIEGPVRDWTELYRDLDKRVLEGFGGVSEYGITVRWDKNFLTLIHLVQTRRRKLRIYDGVRFGGTLTIEDAWNYGFDHIALATGAGKPTIVGMKNNLIRGIRKASDFLMALQLTGAFKEAALANLQVSLPAIVIGGGLTAIDTATELAAYYPMQVEKILMRYERLSVEQGEDRFWKTFDPADRKRIEIFIEHGRQVRRERERARLAREEPDFVSLVRSWGGVSIVYRKDLTDSPAYRLNHEEVIKSLEEGIYFVERLSPVEALADENGDVTAIRFERQQVDATGRWRGTGETVELPAASVCVAAGTSPNVIYEREYSGTFKLDRANQFFQSFRLIGKGSSRRLEQADSSSGDDTGFFTSYENDGRYITFYGDNHPAFAGNVVKAMASAKHGAREITRLFSDEIMNLEPTGLPEREATFEALSSLLDSELIARVDRVVRLTPTIVEVIVRAPAQARKFKPGQFYRLQNYETTAQMIGDTRLAMEGLALTGAWTDSKRGLLSLIVLEMGASSRLCAALREGERVVGMGPTGAPTEIPRGETVLLAGGGLGNAVLFSIARALKANGNRVIYFAGYRKRQDLFKREEIESWTDQVIWSVDWGEMIEPHRPQDHCVTGNIVEAMRAYSDGAAGKKLFDLATVDRIIAIGSDQMMGAVKLARRSGMLSACFKPEHIAIGSINSPMQCMMKEVCAQCLQRHVDPETGAETAFVFSCFNQDQKLDEVDFAHLDARLRMNSAQEKLSNLWLTTLREY
jgi:NADPH-dependent glutamate synthase beta subunit-like oxidoreductase/NAD(P)H-flavin reductase